MKNLRILFLAVLVMVSMTLTSCLHILEEVTFKDKGNGTYAMTLDMSELKGMMDMMKGMTGDSLSGDSTAILGGDAPVAAPEADNSMSQMGEQLSSVAASLKGIQGVSNVVEVNDTVNLKFGYTFDFVDVAALNRALKIINKDKYDSKVDEVFKFSGKSFERLGTGDLGEEIKKALAEGGGEEGGEESLDMMKMMFADMSYKQVYHFPDREIKKADNSLVEMSDNNHTMTILIKPFDEEQQKLKPTVAATAKLK